MDSRVRPGVVGEVAQGLGAGRHTQQHHADVLDHRQQHLAQHFALGADLGCAGSGGHAGDDAQAVEAAQPVHQLGPRCRRNGCDLLVRVIEHVAHRKAQGRDAGVRIKAQGCRNQRRAQRMLPHLLLGAESTAFVDGLDPFKGIANPAGIFGQQALAQQLGRGQEDTDWDIE
jgi:hypothetical protein